MLYLFFSLIKMSEMCLFFKKSMASGLNNVTLFSFKLEISILRKFRCKALTVLCPPPLPVLMSIL